ncbi:dTDP-glucose 4,6-dehydratase [Aerococcus mictus]|uniref:dTDP-glucose 4,6-dehydratase n=1 Tax=Aerococcus mictus TaxID=2976810 RepID=UPI0018A71A4F|nr:dTDP-glucose 4,6-dehydratase [Aerococcus mictus]MCY3034114.1 dTDP-glucose 4,6-dehydratase [Aerococcus mictus]MCY3063885.1 dTDP-glucose 4,6-dehydratase [Aerococcus mictus]MCY3067411.1 dTDP-glucose 4,6-dehydratase [Aerococcus mictus]MCY3070858.1 dTDP-glucose 4,6-dehydratase [Aerococcus mictus]MCY3074892.1 dTDP-glucose 4,6-dehydratase [Aerococcus mictus]
MKLMVTGGAGFIGANFIYYILRKYKRIKIICVDKLTYAGRIENLTKAFDSERFNFAKLDITNRAKVYQLFKTEKPDIVVNFAAESHVDRSIKDPEIFVDTNVLGTTTLMDACLKYGIKRFHRVSTDEVYGDLPLDRPDLLFTEEYPLHPSSPYSSSKASADLFVLAYHRTYGLPISISRCSNNYGPYQFIEKFIPLMIINTFQDKELPIYGDGLNVRDWLYVEDHCAAIDLIIRQGKEGSLYNIGGNNEKSNIEIAQLICGLLNKPKELITYVEDRKGHDRRYAIDSNQIKRDLGWTPKITFEKGIKLTVQWYITHTEWWSSLF